MSSSPPRTPQWEYTRSRSRGAVQSTDILARESTSQQGINRTSSVGETAPAAATASKARSPSPSKRRTAPEPYSPYAQTAAEKAYMESSSPLAAAARASRIPVKKNKPVDTAADTAALAAAQLAQQQVLAQMAMVGATQPSAYMAQLMDRIQSLDVTSVQPGSQQSSTRNIGSLGGLGGALSGTVPNRAQIASPDRPRSAARLEPLAARPSSAAAIPAAAAQLNLAALAYYLTPAQAAQLHMYPQLLVQAAAAAQAQAAKMAPEEVPEPDLAVNAATAVPVSIDTAASPVAAPRSLFVTSPPVSITSASVPFQHRTASGQGWNDSLTPLHPPRSRKDLGTFGAPPPIAYPGSEAWKQARRKHRREEKEERERRKQQGKGGRTTSPERKGRRASAERKLQQQQEDEQDEEDEEEESLPMSPGMAPMLSPLRLTSPTATSASSAAVQEEKSATPLVPPAVATSSPVMPITSSGLSSDKLRHAAPPPPSISGLLYPPVQPRSDLAQSMLDAWNYFEQQPERERMEKVAGMASKALHAVSAQACASSSSPPVASSSTAAASSPRWDVSVHVEQALGPYLAYFSAARQAYHLPKPIEESSLATTVVNVNGVAVANAKSNAAAASAKTDIKNPTASSSKPQKTAIPLQLFTSSSHLTPSNGGLHAPDLHLPSHPSIEADLLREVLVSREWYAKGFAAEKEQQEQQYRREEKDGTGERKPEEEARVLRAETPRKLLDLQALLPPPDLATHIPTPTEERSNQSEKDASIAAANASSSVKATFVSPSSALPHVRPPTAASPAAVAAVAARPESPASPILPPEMSSLLADLVALSQTTASQQAERGVAPPPLIPGFPSHVRPAESPTSASSYSGLPSTSNVPVMTRAEVQALKEIEEARLAAWKESHPPADVPEDVYSAFVEKHARANELAHAAAMTVATLVENGSIAPGKQEEMLTLLLSSVHSHRLASRSALLHPDDARTSSRGGEGGELSSTSIKLDPLQDGYDSAWRDQGPMWSISIPPQAPSHRSRASTAGTHRKATPEQKSAAAEEQEEDLVQLQRKRKTQIKQPPKGFFQNQAASPSNAAAEPREPTVAAPSAAPPAKHSVDKATSPAPILRVLDPLSSVDAAVFEQMIMYVQDGEVDEVERYLRAGVSVASADWSGNQSIHAAAALGDANIIRLCLRWSADVNATNKDSNTPLHFLYAYQHYALAEFLLSQGADPSRCNRYGLIPEQGLGGDQQVEQEEAQQQQHQPPAQQHHQQEEPIVDAAVEQTPRSILEASAAGTSDEQPNDAYPEEQYEPDQADANEDQYAEDAPEADLQQPADSEPAQDDADGGVEYQNDPQQEAYHQQTSEYDEQQQEYDDTQEAGEPEYGNDAGERQD